MSDWSVRSRARRHPARVDARFIVLVAIIIALCFYAYRQQRHAPSLAPVEGRAYVVDGDTVDVWSTRVRLIDIDAPELDQSCRDARGRAWPCGRAATRELKARIGRQKLRCEPTKFDRYGRVLAVCFLPDGSDVNAWMVRQGWALAYGRSSAYRSAQDEAEAAKRGIWAGTFTAPWDWRHHD